MGTKDKGLFVYDQELGKFRAFSIDDGLADNMVLGILEDEHGFFWISTNTGLSRFDPETNTFNNYDASDGLPSPEFNLNVSHQGAYTGNLYFGTMEGLVVFHPDSIRLNDYRPSIVISKLTYLMPKTNRVKGRITKA